MWTMQDMIAKINKLEINILIIIPTNGQPVLLYTIRLHVSTFIGHHQGTKECQKL
jgi:hypothetical protein